MTLIKDFNPPALEEKEQLPFFPQDSEEELNFDMDQPVKGSFEKGDMYGYLDWFYDGDIPGDE